MKVYELAKDLKIRSVDLVDKLRREWNIPVKNHMQKLNAADMEKIRSFLAKEQQKTVKSVIKKKSPVKKAVVKKPAVSVRRVSEDSAATPTQPDLESVPVLRTGIIRRKKIAVKSITSAPATEKKKDSRSVVKKAAANLSMAEAIRPIRSGLVPGESVDILKKINESIGLSESEVEIEKKKVKKASADRQGQGRQFRATDFRKREMIFQPKKKRLFAGASGKSTIITKPKTHKRVLKIYNTISIEDLSHKMGVKKQNLLNRARKEGLWKENESLIQDVPYETAALIASLFDFEVKNLSKKEEDIMTVLAFGNLTAEKKTKPPVVTVMGHVDHGKTTLLDFIRKSRVAGAEAGGITQHIGAYSVPVSNSFVTFIDTPGHSAFTALRARGSQITDIVVIVVAADDGVQPQTIEAINHAKSAKAPIIVAVNKIDLAAADVERVKKQMTKQELTPEEWGGETIFCPLSARTGKGVKELLEHIHLLAEVHELKANPLRSGVGVVMESRLQKGRGQIMTLLVQDGTLKKGQVILAGRQVGRVRQMTDDKGQIISAAEPGRAVEVSGFNGMVLAGDKFYVVKSEKEARKWLAESSHQSQSTENPLSDVSAEDLLLKAHVQQIKTLNVVLKTDVTGSIEAIKYSLGTMNTDEVKSQVIHSSQGVANENDVLLAHAGAAVILCFNVGLDPKARRLAVEKNVMVKSHKVIYELLEDVESMMAELLDPEIKETFSGRAEVRQVFHISNIGTVAGCYVSKGKISNDHFIRVIREEKILHEEKISSLKHLKQSIKTVSEGQECGIGLSKYKDFKPGDTLESFIKTEIKRKKL